MFLINLQGKESIYEQIRNQIQKFITTGILKPDDRLPSVRSLAGDLGINPNTVMKAYQELEREGYIYTLNKKGVFVSGTDRDTKSGSLDEAARLLTHLRESGITRNDVLELLDTIYGEE